MKIQGVLGFLKPISLILAWKWVTQKSRKAMNGEESLSFPRTLCTESREGKQDLAFIGVILGNREIDSDKYLFCLNVCVSWLLLCTEVTLCHANSIYMP